MSPKVPPATTGSALVPPVSASTTRESSLDSFDVVSSANASVSGERPAQVSTNTKDNNEGEDEEEEEDEDEEEGEEEGKEEDSDWE